MNTIFVFLLVLGSFAILVSALIWSVKFSARQRTEMDRLPLPARRAVRPTWLSSLDSVLCLMILVLANWPETDAAWKIWLILAIASGLFLLHRWFAFQNLRVRRKLSKVIQPELNRALRVEAVSHGLAALIYAMFGVVFGPMRVL